MNRKWISWIVLALMLIAPQVAESYSYFQHGGLVTGESETAAVGGTTALTVVSNQVQVFTGSGNQTVTLPDATSLISGWWYVVDNESTGTLTVQDNGNNLLSTMKAGTSAWFWIGNVASSSGNWRYKTLTQESSIDVTKLQNLGADFLPQYLTTARGDARDFPRQVYISTYQNQHFAPIVTNGSGLIDISLLPVFPGSGTTTGPAVSTVNAVPRWGNAIGTGLLNSGVLIDGSNNVTIPSLGAGIVHSSAGGLLTSSAVNLASEVTGNLGVTNLNSGTSASNTTFWRGDGVWAVAGTGSVTSVGLSDGSSTPIFTISGSPVTTSGTLTETLATESANTSLMGPTTGAAAQPTFRLLVAADAPAGGQTGGTVWGNGALVNDTDSTAIGNGAQAQTQSLAVGFSTRAGTGSAGNVGTAVGYGAQATNTRDTAFGHGSSANADGASAFGDSALANFQASMAMGYNAQTTAANQWVVGGATSRALTDAYFGAGVTVASPADITFQASGGSGSNNAGANFILAGGKSTGNAAIPALILKTATATTSGSTLQSLVERARITDALQLQETFTPSNPASSSDKIYFKSDHNLYVLNPSGIETQLAASTPGGSDQQVQYNSGGTSFAGNSGFVFLATSTRIGLNTVSPAAPAATLDINGTLAYRSNDVNWVGTITNLNIATTSLVRLSGVATATIQGLANGASGTIVTLMNDTGVNVLLQNENAGASAANRIKTGIGSDLAIATDSAVTLQYDPVATRWKVHGPGFMGCDQWTSYPATFSNLGAVTNIHTMSRRCGNALDLQLDFTMPGSGSAGSPASISLGYQGTNSNVTAGNLQGAAWTFRGFGTCNGSGTTLMTVLSAPGSQVVEFGFDNLSSTPLTPQNGSSFPSSVPCSFSAFGIPIQGW